MKRFRSRDDHDGGEVGLRGVVISPRERLTWRVGGRDRGPGFPPLFRLKGGWP
jgi:hypothetical protein